MPRKLKVLISAYACEPNKGSEPDVGWQWAMQMARFHDVTVLTRANNRLVIENELANLPAEHPRPAFVYHDESVNRLRLKKEFNAVKIYYLLWQRSAQGVIRQLHHEHQFDLLHHVTFAGFRYPAAIWGHGVPTIWGPIGGVESIPFSLLPWSHPKSLLMEILRDANNVLQTAPFYVLPKRARATTTILASTTQMGQTFARLGANAQVMPTIGLNTGSIPHHPPARHNGPLKLLFVGNIITLKGVDLALHAFKEAQANATFTLIGTGDYLPAARRLTQKLGLAERVFFRDRLPRNELLKLYSEFDVFVFPSLHDTGGYAVIEAMCQELPVICLNCGGPALAVQEGCGIKVDLGSRVQMVSQLAQAIQSYDQNRERLREDGRRARENILCNYDWEKKGAQMNEVYAETVKKAAQSSKVGKRYSGIGNIPFLMNQIFSLRGAVITLLGFLLIGALGFLSLHQLKNEATLIVNDTLPGLTYAGEANAYLADAARTLLVVVNENPDQRHVIREEITRLSERTTQYLERYGGQIDSPEDRNIYTALIQARQAYVQIRDQVIELALAGKHDEALKVYNESLMPAQKRVKSAGDKLFEFNMHEGETRGRHILAICTVTQIGVAAFGIAIFLAGFFFGLFK